VRQPKMVVAQSFRPSLRQHFIEQHRAGVMHDQAIAVLGKGRVIPWYREQYVLHTSEPRIALTSKDCHGNPNQNDKQSHAFTSRISTNCQGPSVTRPRKGPLLRSAERVTSDGNIDASIASLMSAVAPEPGCTVRGETAPSFFPAARRLCNSCNASGRASSTIA
jgi:hypothetical protein